MMYLIGQFRLILCFDIRTDKFFGIVIKVAHLYGFQGSWNVIPRMLAKKTTAYRYRKSGISSLILSK